MLSSLTSSVQSLVQSIGIAPVGILALLSLLVIAGLVAGIYQEAKQKKMHKISAGFLKSEARPLIAIARA